MMRIVAVFTLAACTMASLLDDYENKCMSIFDYDEDQSEHLSFWNETRRFQRKLKKFKKIEHDWSRGHNHGEFYQKLLRKAFYQNMKHLAKRNQEDDFKIVGGHDVTNHTWPFLVNIGNVCGGTIIARDLVLTAAHCCANLRRGTFVSGGYLKKDEWDNRQVRKVKSHMLHDNYNEFTVEYDVCLIKVDKKFNYDEYVAPVCLWPYPLWNQEKLFIGGWGNLEENGNSPDELQEAEVNVINVNLCNRYDYYSGRVFEDSMFCAGIHEGGIDSCQGDSGGPAIIIRKNLIFQAGVVSWGSGCAREKKPGVYARLSAVIDWIQTASNQLRGIHIEFQDLKDLSTLQAHNPIKYDIESSPYCNNEKLKVGSQVKARPLAKTTCAVMPESITKAHEVVCFEKAKHQQCTIKCRGKTIGQMKCKNSTGKWKPRSSKLAKCD